MPAPAGEGQHQHPQQQQQQQRIRMFLATVIFSLNTLTLRAFAFASRDCILFSRLNMCDDIPSYKFRSLLHDYSNNNCEENRTLVLDNIKNNLFSIFLFFPSFFFSSSSRASSQTSPAPRLLPVSPLFPSAPQRRNRDLRPSSFLLTATFSWRPCGAISLRLHAPPAPRRRRPASEPSTAVGRTRPSPGF